ncbi:hypothetical protein ABZP36_020336 [Zizania latifolia]
MAAILVLIVFLVSASLVIRSWRARGSEEKARYAAGLRPYPLVGHLPQFLSNRHRILDWMTEVLAQQPTGTFVLRRPGGVREVVTVNPANVEHFLRARFDNYPKGELFASRLHDFLGGGMFNADGEAWRVQRKAASYEFNTRSLRAFVAGCVHREIHGRLLPLLRRAAASGGSTIDLQDTLERFSFDNICRVAFDHDPGQLPDGDDDDARTEFDGSASAIFADAFRDAANISAGRFRYAVPEFWKVKKALNVGSERRLRESIRIVHDFADRIIRSRREEMIACCEKRDLLSRFMAIQDVRYSEAQADDVLPDGTAVGAGWFVAYNTYAMGRMEAVWGEDAAEFRPERWLDPVDGTFRPDSPFRYVVFHGGPRLCLGKEMAYIQMKSIIACVLQELELVVVGAYRPRQVASLTLRMADGLPVRVKVRHG